MKTILSRNKIIVSKNNIILPNNRQSVRISETKTGGSIRKSITTTSFPIGITNSGSQPIKMSKNLVILFPFCPERSLTPTGETVVDCTHVPDPREAPRPLLPYRHEVVTRWELQD